MNRRGVLTTFKSKSLDLLGTSRILPPQHQRHRMTDEHSPGRNAAAERRRRLFRRKKANSASNSYDESPSGSQQSRSSSVESNQSTAHVIHRGLESALKTSTLFAWSSVEASSSNQHLLQQTNQPSFIECKSPTWISLSLNYSSQRSPSFDALSLFSRNSSRCYRSSRVRLHRVRLAAARWQCFLHFLLLFLSWIYRVLLRVRWAKTYVCRRRCSGPVGRPTCCPSCCLQIASLDGGDGARQVLKSR